MKKEKKEKKSYIIAKQMSDWFVLNEINTADAIDAMARLIGLAIGCTVDYEEIEDTIKSIYDETLKSAYYAYKKNQAN